MSGHNKVAIITGAGSGVGRAVAIAFLPGASSSWAGLALALLTGFQARDVQRWTLARRGLPESGVVAGADEEVALLRLGGRSPAGRPA